VQADPSPSLQSISRPVRKSLERIGSRSRVTEGDVVGAKEGKVAGSSLPARKLKKSIPLHSTPRSVTPVIVSVRCSLVSLDRTSIKLEDGWHQV
jgi:hypothetical protein